MKRTLLIFFLGCVGAFTAHTAWFAVHRPVGGSGADAQLAWMKTTLNLSPEQYARIKAVHERADPHMRALAAEVTRLRTEFAAFENARRISGEVDFLAYARFVEQRRAVDRECAESTRRLIVASVNVMTPQQSNQYCLALLNSAPKPAAAFAPN
jgi:hypothetical protein